MWQHKEWRSNVAFLLSKHITNNKFSFCNANVKLKENNLYIFSLFMNIGEAGNIRSYSNFIWKIEITLCVLCTLIELKNFIS